MDRRLLPFFASGTIILFVISILHTFGVTGTGKRMEFQTINQWIGGKRPASGNYVIQSGDEWFEAFGQQSPPEVDFSRITVIAVFMGMRPNGGYSIRVKEIIDTGLSVVVKVEETYPGRNCVLPQIITSPFHVVKTDKMDKYIMFDRISIIRECG